MTMLKMGAPTHHLLLEVDPEKIPQRFCLCRRGRQEGPQVLKQTRLAREAAKVGLERLGWADERKG